MNIRISGASAQPGAGPKRRFDWMKWLIPLALVAPAFKIGPYGVGTTDLLILLLGTAGIIGGRKRSGSGSPVNPYVVLFFLGWLLATLNGVRFGVHFQVGDLVIIYRLGFCYLAWQIGYWSWTSMERTSTRWFTLALIGFTVALAVLFAISPVDRRLQLISYFQPISKDIEIACRIGRFPGVNEFVNIYAFLPLCLLIFGFRAYMIGRASLLVPALASILIVALGSRTAMLLAVAAIAVIFLYPQADSLDPAERIRWGAMRARNRLLTGFAIFLMGATAVGLATRGLVSDRGIEKLAAEETVGTTQYRLHKWQTGMERVLMAPLLGIPQPRGSEEANLNYYLTMSRPHNEFIQIWMWYGLLGLLAHVYLLFSLLHRNLQHRTGAVWYLFYVVVILRMLAVSNFKSYHFSAVFFMIAGYNWKLIEQKTLALRYWRRGPRSIRPPVRPGATA